MVPSALVNEVIYEGVQSVWQEGYLPVIIHFPGKIDSKNIARGIYTKMAPQTDKVIDQGADEYAQSEAGGWREISL